MALRYVNPNRGGVTVTPEQLAEIRAALREISGRTDDADRHHDDGNAAMRPRQITNRSAEAQIYPMKCRVRNAGASTRVDLFDDIGAGLFSEGLTAKSFSEQLAALKGPLDVHINSHGGAVDDGIAIASTLRNYKGFKRTVVDGFAASIASVIFQAGDERVTEPGSMVFVHDAMTFCVGNADEMSKAARTLDKHSDNIASIYAGRAGGTVGEWRDVMRAETWYTADEAVSAGLADRVGDGAAELPAGMDLAAFYAVPDRIAARLQSMPRQQRPAGSQDQPTPQMLQQVRTALRDAF